MSNDACLFARDISVYDEVVVHGEVAILIGSTPKVGMGTNVQTRMTDLWHLDAPWLPSEMIQRDGRVQAKDAYVTEVLGTGGEGR